MTARDEILLHYSVDSEGYIVSPGKFEGTPIYAPYFYSQVPDSFENVLDYCCLVYVVTNDDVNNFPEITAKGIEVGDKVLMFADDQGFINCWSSVTDE